MGMGVSWGSRPCLHQLGLLGPVPAVGDAGLPLCLFSEFQLARLGPEQITPTSPLKQIKLCAWWR